MTGFRKSKIDELKLDHAPFIAACRDAGDLYLIREDHPQQPVLRRLYLPTAERKTQRKKQVTNWGSEMWAELHRWSLTCDVSDVYGQLAWLYQWSMKLPVFGCQCLPHWAEMLHDDPPDFSSNVALFEWTVAVHNAVNRRIQKKTMKVVDARERWAA